MGRQPSAQLSAGKLFRYSPGRRLPFGGEAAPLRWGAPSGEELQACPRHVHALPLHIASGRPLSCGPILRQPSATPFVLLRVWNFCPPCTGVTCSGVLQCSLLPFSASQARTGVFSAVTGHRPRHGVDGGRRAWALPWPRPAAPAEPIRIGVTPGTPILGRRRPRHGPSAVSPAFGRGNDFQRHRIFLLLHRTSGGCAQDSPRIHPAVMPHPARGAGHPQ